MSNALETLFSDIANAIREKNGETETMKPAEFPEKISAIETGGTEVPPEEVEVELNFGEGDNQIIVPSDSNKTMSKVTIQKPENLIPENVAEGINIAGIIGTLVAGSGGGDAKYFYTTIVPTATTGIVVNHGLGVIPDAVLVFLDGNVYNGYMQLYFGISPALYEKLGSGAANMRNFGLGMKYNSYSVVKGNDTIDRTSTTLGIRNASANSITIGSSQLPLLVSNKHHILAISGLT